MGELHAQTVDQVPRTLVAFDDWESADRSQRGQIASDAVATLEPGWLGSDLGSGLISAEVLHQFAGIGQFKVAAFQFKALAAYRQLSQRPVGMRATGTFDFELSFRLRQLPTSIVRAFTCRSIVKLGRWQRLLDHSQVCAEPR